MFAPHPNDETLGCGGTIMKKMSEGLSINISHD
jgi:LmbE family N-acetylglucosaminyl deacetylase